MDNFEELVTPIMVRNMFQNHTLGAPGTRWCVVVAGNILSIGGKPFYESREAANKAFYNFFRWSALSNMSRAASGNLHYWNDPNRTQYWKSFKKALKENYGFDIVRV